jgi:hypothetical protein
MKKFLMLAMLVMAIQFTNAQDKQFDKINTVFILNKFEDAKTEIDKIMADPKGQAKAEGWLWKSRIYAEFYATEEGRAKYSEAGTISFDAFKKYESMDAEYKLLADSKVSWRPLDLIYVTSFNQGRKYFEKKKWDSSFTTFLVTEYLGEIICKKDLRKTGAKIDTISVLYTAYAAQNAKKESEAAKYYEKFADLKIAGDEYKDGYAYILVYAANTKNSEKFYKYLAIAKEVYPKGDWEDYEADFLNKNYTIAQKIELYDKEDAAGTLTARKYLLFGQMFSDATRDDKHTGLDSATHAKYDNKAKDAYIKAYNKDNTLGLAAFNAGVIFYNDFGVYEERYNNNRRALQELNSNKVVEKDPKKRPAAEAKFKEQADVLKKAMIDSEKPLLESVDNSIIWLEKAFTVLKAGDTKEKTIRNCLNSSVKWLANCFIYKREKVKGKDLKAYDAYDAKYKEYDALYNKF